MPKIHGQGGKTGHQSAETRGRVKKMYESTEKIKRAQAKRAREQDRKISIVSEEIKTRINPIATSAIERVVLALKIKKVSRPTALIVNLAIDEWHIDEIVKALNAKKIGKEEFTPQDFESFHFLTSEQRTDIIAALLPGGKIKTSSRSTIQLRADINKWKRRVPKIVKGEYL